MDLAPRQFLTSYPLMGRGAGGPLQTGGFPAGVAPVTRMAAPPSENLHSSSSTGDAVATPGDGESQRSRAGHVTRGTPAMVCLQPPSLPHPHVTSLEPPTATPLQANLFSPANTGVHAHQLSKHINFG